MVIRPVFVLLVACASTLTLSVSLSAQSAGESAPRARLQFGPLGLTPRIAVRDVGIDTNPLNAPDASQRDFTATVEPGVDSSLRIGRGVLTASTSLEWVYYRNLASQRSLNASQTGRAELFLNRLVPYAFGGYLRTRQRPNLEVDVRVQQFTTLGGAGTGLRLGSRLRVDLEASRSSLAFGRGRHGDDDIARALDREIELAAVASRYALTGLTTFVLRTEVQRDRFEFSPVRNTDSFSIVPGVELKPSALIAGEVRVGYRRFRPLEAAVPAFSGVVGKVEARYVWREATRLTVTAERNVDYSIELEQPYFLLTGGGASMMQMLGASWYAEGRLGRSRLMYREMAVAGMLPSNRSGRSDRVDAYGVGFGRLLGSDLRIGVNLDFARRQSTLPTHQYEGYRFGGTISYGS